MHLAVLVKIIEVIAPALPGLLAGKQREAQAKETLQFQLAQANARKDELEQSRELSLLIDKRNREFNLSLVEIQSKNALNLAEDAYDLQHWPLIMSPKTFIKEHTDQDKPSLKVLLSPLSTKQDAYPPIDIVTQERSFRIENAFDKFIRQHYPDTKFISGAWKTKHIARQAAVTTLHARLASLPVIVVEADAHQNTIELYIGGWSIYGEQTFHTHAATIRQDQLIKELISLQSATKGQENTSDSIQLPESSKIDEEFAAAVGHVMSILIAGTIDVFQLVHLGIPPQLPRLMQDLPNNYPASVQGVIDELFAEFLKAYELAYSRVAKDAPSAKPWSLLSYAVSLSSLADKSYAKNAVTASLRSWIEHSETSLSSVTDADLMWNVLQSARKQDVKYILEVKNVLTLLDDSERLEVMQRDLSSLHPLMPKTIKSSDS